MVEFTVASQSVTTAEMTGHLGEADEVTVLGEPGRVTGRPARENAWSLRAEGGAGDDVDALVESVLVRIAGREPGLTALRAAGCELVLRVVQYMAETDPVGPGFAVDTADLALLARIGASLDVDLYVRGGR